MAAPFRVLSVKLFLEVVVIEIFDTGIKIINGAIVFHNIVSHFFTDAGLENLFLVFFEFYIIKSEFFKDFIL